MFGCLNESCISLNVAWIKTIFIPRNQRSQLGNLKAPPFRPDERPQSRIHCRLVCLQLPSPTAQFWLCICQSECFCFLIIDSGSGVSFHGAL
ncbi:hypothetical protein CEXT_76341 [Caerostris extrusa]|uniref:Uncharacterized protein n=1 Tax=Caerostris extrusa TaxID=172846 RepID=A0AAV4TRD2_CAEEX|nr:hypothetical protein CEXT_76341 [Caerostris extrusa]